MDQRLPQQQITVDAAHVVRWHRAERLMSLPPGWQILRSDDIAWLHPTPSLDWYRRLYEESYLSDPTNPCFPDNDAFERRRLTYFDARLTRIARHLGHQPDSVLDVGCGDGLFLLAAKRRGIAATGVDVSSRACADARAQYGVHTVPGNLLEPDLAIADRYEVIVMNHVLEHLTRPLSYLDRVRELLQPGGVFVFEIPQQFINPIDLLYRAVGVRRPLGAYTLHHPYFYTVSSVRRLMRTADYKVEHLTTWLPNQVFHTQNRWVTTPLQGVLWLADRLVRRGHIIEVFARPR